METCSCGQRQALVGTTPWNAAGCARRGAARAARPRIRDFLQPVSSVDRVQLGMTPPESASDSEHNFLPLAVQCQCHKRHAAAALGSAAARARATCGRLPARVPRARRRLRAQRPPAARDRTRARCRAGATGARDGPRRVVCITQAGGARVQFCAAPSARTYKADTVVKL